MQTIAEYAALAFEAAAIGVMIMFSLGAVVRYLQVRSSAAKPYEQFRETFVTGLLLSLDLLVAADIIDTVSAEKTFESLGLLAILVLIRTFMHFSLKTEMKGMLPWKAGPEAAE